MYTIYDGKVYKINKDKLVGVDITPTSINMVGEVIPLPKIYRVYTLKEIKSKLRIFSGYEYKFPITEKKIDISTLTKKEIMLELDKKKIKYNPADKKGVLEELLRG